jgi:hypothetical protein
MSQVWLIAFSPHLLEHVRPLTGLQLGLKAARSKTNAWKRRTLPNSSSDFCLPASSTALGAAKSKRTLKEASRPSKSASIRARSFAVALRNATMQSRVLILQASSLGNDTVYVKLTAAWSPCLQRLVAGRSDNDLMSRAKGLGMPDGRRVDMDIVA